MGRVDDILSILTDIQKQQAVQEERTNNIRLTIADLSERVDELGDDVSQMRAMANRWKGGFIVLVGLGGIVGWVLSTWSTLSGVLGSLTKTGQ